MFPVPKIRNAGRSFPISAAGSRVTRIQDPAPLSA